MIFTCDAREIAQAMETVSHALAGKPIVQAYGNALLTAGGDSLTLYVSDGTIHLSAAIAAQVEEAGTLALDGKMLLDTLRRQPGGALTLKTDRKGAVITCGRSKIQLMLENAEGICRQPGLKDSAMALRVPAASLQRCIDYVQYAVSMDQTRKVLTGILLELAPGHLRAVAMDGFRLARRAVDCAYDGPEVSAIIPRPSAVELARLLKDAGQEEVTLVTDGSYLSAGIGGCSFFTGLIAGQYVTYEQVIPQERSVAALLRTADLRGCMERAQILARVGKGNLIRLAFNQRELRVSARAESGDFEEYLDISLQGEPLEIAFNCNYLLDALKNTGAEEIEIGMVNPVRPAVIRERGSDDCLQLVLPVRIL